MKRKCCGSISRITEAKRWKSRCYGRESNLVTLESIQEALQFETPCSIGPACSIYKTGKAMEDCLLPQ